ncbi:expansin-like A2 [Impatiens glandulifera]|uniref:expansin-like A2 n=1 Tax=Impatiens glandulifera TaxID=253017 RepID=UPI001FB06762|nr:expansin-like A2 [Impatiens glandulifera]
MYSSTYFCFLHFFFVLIVSSSATAACDRCLHNSKVAYFSGDYAISRGACGYGSLTTSFSNGMVAAASPSIYKKGAGCGSCFNVGLVFPHFLYLGWISCKNATLCSKQGTKVIVTDLNNDKNTDFVLTRSAFVAMASKGKERDILRQGILDVQYRRIPCEYKNKNLTINVDESSHRPSYLALKFIFQGGQTEIVEVDVAQVGSLDWSSLNRRGNDAVWATSRVPSGALQMRMVVTSGFDGKWIYTKHSVLPANWTPGSMYDSGLQITEIAREGCSPCDEEQI